MIFLIFTPPSNSSFMVWIFIRKIVYGRAPKIMVPFFSRQPFLNSPRHCHLDHLRSCTIFMKSDKDHARSHAILARFCENHARSHHPKWLYLGEPKDPSVPLWVRYGILRYYVAHFENHIPDRKRCSAVSVLSAVLLSQYDSGTPGAALKNVRDLWLRSSISHLVWPFHSCSITDAQLLVCCLADKYI